MTIAYPILKDIVAATFVIVMFSGSGHSQQADINDESQLLAALALADESQARRLNRQLQSLWSKSGSPSADLLLQRGRDALEADDIEAAIEHLTALTDHAPDFAEAWHARASAYFAADLLGPAVADLERALALNPNQYDAIFGLGLIFEALNRPEQAYQAYERALAIHPHHEQVTNAMNRLQSRVEGQSL
ncbi:tetratricopeptide repeat protein [Ruegeria sp. 2205SS24-7]|uniref:tetratricopeptide repeat protein n=1 Tax=Ruegeria discodermiae TaxID=3064389 RepID=UPI0027413911|nr:tetratricopeptide repeat protein [Ruegeria sp. 2205SS24-7]MDP5215788.1 tetratricopeptide repeat protein [Ruegeria sp. 2205SS24-7]